MLYISAEDKKQAGSQYLYPPETKKAQITDTNAGGYPLSSTMWGTQVFQLFVLSPVSDQFQQLVLTSLATENTSHSIFLSLVFVVTRIVGNLGQSSFSGLLGGLFAQSRRITVTIT